MATILNSEPMPLCENEHGDIRVGNTRVLLESVVHAYQRGESAEVIAANYPVLELADVYFAIGYYLRHRSEVEEYLRRQELRAEEIRHKLGPMAVDFSEVKRRWLERQTSGSDGGAPAD